MTTPEVKPPIAPARALNWVSEAREAQRSKGVRVGDVDSNMMGKDEVGTVWVTGDGSSTVVGQE